MKRRFTILTAAFALLAMLAIPMGMWGQTRTEEVYSTCLFGANYNPSNSGYTGSFVATNGDYSWTITNGNNNNNGWTNGSGHGQVKFGRKNVESVGQITTIAAYSEAITKVELTIDALTVSKINSIKLYSGTSSDNITTLEGEFQKAVGTQTVAITNPAANNFYDIKFDCASGSSNGLITISMVVYYYNAGGNLPVVTPSITPEGGPFYETREVSISCATEGATIHYTTNGSDPTPSSPTYTAPFSINANTTVKAIGVKEGMDNSSIASAEFTKVTPMSVADAIATIEAGPTPIEDQCVTGIVCTASNNIYSGKLSYWISDDGTTNNRLEAYNGLGLDGASFESVDDVQVGDVVVIYGDLTKYNSTYEFTAGNYLLSLVRPAVAVEAPIFSPAAGTYENGQEVTITCATEGAIIYYTTDGTEPTSESTQYTAAINVATTTTIKAIAINGSDESTVATATYHINSQTNPYTVAQALAFFEYPANGIYVHGIVSTAPSELLSGGYLTYYISDDGETTTQLQVYKGKNLEQAEFTSVDDIQVGDIVTIYGNVKIYNNEKEFDKDNYLVSFERPASTEPSIAVDPATVSIPVEGAEGTLTVTYENITEIVAEVWFCNADGTTAATYDWIIAEINDDNNIEYLVEENDGEARTAYFKVYALDANANDVYSNIVTVNQAAYVAPVEPGTWVLTDLADLTADDIFVIVGTDADNDTFALPNNGGTTTAPSATAITIVDGTISGEPAEILQWNLSGNATDGYTFYPNGNTASWLYCTNTNNGVRVGTNDNKTFKMDEDGYMVNDATSRVLSIFVNNGIPQDWRCYANYNNNPVVISFYKKVEPVEPETYTLDITGYSNSAGGYYLIATPVASVTPSAENGFLTDAYDLYEFDQSAANNEWVNYETHFFDLVSGKGYLYASQTNTTLTFTGTPYTGNGEIELVYDDEATFKGWNLIGNPFGVTATVDHDYYVINDTGEGEDFIITSKETPVAAMQGLFVVTEGTDDNKAIFTTEEPETPGEKLVLNVSRNRGIVDRAMIRFGEGHQMPKAMLNENHTKLYIPQANNEYAVVRSDNEDAMPVNFKAATNGTYTLNVNAENLEMDYLHLIDNMTGTDIDLLQTPSYSFEANTTDYANRFKLVYRNTTNVEENGESFAYFNGNEWVISNEGDAQLHVIDMTGRIVSTETIYGNATVKVNAAPGVYMLSLVNGNDIKTQKVIIK